MKLRIRLTVIISAMLAVVLLTLSGAFIKISTDMQKAAAADNLLNTAGLTARDIQRRFEVYLEVTRTLAEIMNGFESIDPSERRIRYDDMLYSLLSTDTRFIDIYTLWLPNALDDMDENYVNSQGTDATGQYISMYSRETGSVEYRAHPNPSSILNGLGAVATMGDPVPRTVEGKQTYTISLNAPIIGTDGVTRGAVGVNVDMGILQPIIAAIRPYGVGEVSLMANNGMFMAHFRADRIGTNFQQTSLSTLGDAGVRLTMESAQNGKPVNFQSKGVEIVTYPFYVRDIPKALLVGVTVPVETVFARTTAMTRLIIIVVIVFILAGAVIAFLVAWRIAKPILTVSEVLKDISQGEGDLTRTITINTKDEIEDLAHYFNLTIEKIRDLIILIKKQSISLFDIGTELSSNMTETAAAMNEISAHIHSLRSQVGNQTSSVSETNATMEGITGNIEKLNGHIEDQTSHISQSSTAIEEMIANINSVTQTIIRNLDRVKQLASASEIGRNGLEEVSTDIQEIAKESEGLLEITAVMENIASQTTLLSMNAAIEAAHAGESGKGFAVVADEIRKLAESSGEQSKTIAVVLKKIKDSIDKIMKSTDEVLSRFEAIDSGVKTVSGQEEQVKNAMEEQGTGSQQILTVLAHLNEITQFVRNGSGEMLRGSKEIIKESRNLGQVTGEVANAINEMSSGAEQVNEAVNRVSTLSVDNKQHIDTLVQEISRFKVE
ncbi:MAG: methyl-accepting chemotaxis protein [Spirochaetaceae bacterium]|jgi:methyl-accepting chemotaxis protein|nr:methyl-accepting chemotaxis protein [Spirochaetaceae bacterium]